jgi:hypothetical protein
MLSRFAMSSSEGKADIACANICTAGFMIHALAKRLSGGYSVLELEFIAAQATTGHRDRLRQGISARSRNEAG